MEAEAQNGTNSTHVVFHICSKLTFISVTARVTRKTVRSAPPPYRADIAEMQHATRKAWPAFRLSPTH
jgi:hypothetical protein